MELKDLQRALNYAKSVHVQMGYTVLADAVERFLSAQPKAVPVAPKQQPQQSSPDLSEFIERVRDLKKSQTVGCPECGAVGAHYCTGRKPSTVPFTDTWHPPFGTGTGIEYLNRQPTCISNFDTNPRRNEILAQIFGKNPVGAQGGANACYTGSGRVTEGGSKI